MEFDKQNWNQIKYSYAAASVFPIKILLNNGLVRNIRVDRKIPMIHVQLNLSNRCTRNCSFCSCSNRDKSIEMPYEDVIDVMRKAKKCGCQSVTITGDAIAI